MKSVWLHNPEAYQGLREHGEVIKANQRIEGGIWANGGFSIFYALGMLSDEHPKAVRPVSTDVYKSIF